MDVSIWFLLLLLLLSYSCSFLGFVFAPGNRSEVITRRASKDMSVISLPQVSVPLLAQRAGFLTSCLLEVIAGEG
jgi:hypothetical protein